MKKAAAYILKIRVPLLILISCLTVFFGYQAGNLKTATDFSSMIPQKHEYIKNHQPFKELFGGGNQIMVEVSVNQGTVLTHDFLSMLRKINEDVMFIKGVDRLTVRSLISPETTYLTINEEGFNIGPVVPNVIPNTQEGMARIEKNILLGIGVKGILVSMDLKSAMIKASVYESGVDYLHVYKQLNEIREKYSVEDSVSIHINGFAMVVGFVNDALPRIFGLFGLASLITFLILYRCFKRIFRLAALPLLSGIVSVLWSLGIIRFFGMNLDPMTTIVPFLVFAIGVSHGTQMIKRYIEESTLHKDSYNAALNALSGLLVPGLLALVTDAIGFLTILFVPIGVIQDLAVTASIGIACIIVINTLGLPLILSCFSNFMTDSPKIREKLDKNVSSPPFILRFIIKLAQAKYAYRVAGMSLVLLLIGFFTARTMTVGDVNPGEPLLWEDSVYNTDAAKIMKDFGGGGIDTLSVVVAGEEQGICKDQEVINAMKDYEWEMWHLPGVFFVLSPLMLVEVMNEMMHEGDIRWRDVPKDRQLLAVLMSQVTSNKDDEFTDMGCQNINIRIFLKDHKGDTIRRVINRTKAFIEDHPLTNARFLLAGSNAGVMAATNEEVADAQFPMLFLIYLSIFILCALIFKNIRAPLFILSPLFLVSILSTAFMKAWGLGLNVNTLPVASLGVGIGVDYGIYIYSRLSEEREKQPSFDEAVMITLSTSGAAVLYTALTLSAGVLTWLLSDLKFQADMGLLLGFIFITNMISAMILMPALIYIFDEKGILGRSNIHS